MGRESQARALRPNFTVVTFKMWAYTPKIKMVIFLYKYAQKKYTPYVIFTLVPNFTVVAATNCGLSAPKTPKNGNLWYKFAPKGILWGSTEKVEYGCTTTNLHVCNDTIIVLKITLLHSVFVITNFITPKRDIQTNKQITLLRLQPARDPRSLANLAC